MRKIRETDTEVTYKLTVKESLEYLQDKVEQLGIAFTKLQKDNEINKRSLLNMIGTDEKTLLKFREFKRQHRRELE